MQRQVVIFWNPKAGSASRRARVEELRGQLEGTGFQVTLLDQVADLKALLRSPPHPDVVVAAGGDGTAELVANHLPEGVALGVLPLGTENLLAKYLEVAPDPNRHVEQLVCWITQGTRRTLDAGRIRNGRMFLLMLSCGFDADVVHRMHSQRRSHISRFSYAGPILSAVRHFQYPALVVEYERDQERVEVDCHWVFVFNTPLYAAGLRVVADADPSDGLLDVATFHGGSFWHGLRHFWGVLTGSHRSMADFRHARANHVKIRRRDATSGVLPKQGEPVFQTDGDPGGVLPIEIDILPRRLTIVTGT